MMQRARKVGESAGRNGNRGMGRKKGIPNKFTGTLKDMILKALDDADAEGGAAYLTKQAKNNPAAFLTLVGKVLPMQITGPNGGAIVHRIELVAPTAEDLARGRP